MRPRSENSRPFGAWRYGLCVHLDATHSSKRRFQHAGSKDPPMRSRPGAWRQLRIRPDHNPRPEHPHARIDVWLVAKLRRHEGAKQQPTSAYVHAVAKLQHAVAELRHPVAELRHPVAEL